MNIADNINYLQHRILREEEVCHRSKGSVTLLAVSKGQPTCKIEDAYQAGICDFGENYLQEGLKKIKCIANPSIRWHFIGPIQSNKARDIATHFCWVHSVSSSKVAQLLDTHRPADMPPLNVCLQVNLDNELSKAGVLPDDVEALARTVLTLPHLHLSGLMSIPKPETDTTLQFQSFSRLNTLLQQLNQTLGIDMKTLSMGMSHDFPAAIRAGSTIVRIGTALFGERQVTL